MGMTTAIDITMEQRKVLLALLRHYLPGVLVWAYGSRVKWTARLNSDLDLVAFTLPSQSPLVSELKEAFAESSDIPFLVDLHVWDEIPERFRDIIRKEYVVLQRAEERTGGNVVEDGLFPVACKDWSWLPLAEVCCRGGGDIQTGPFGSQLHASDYVTEGIPSVMPQNISHDRVCTEGIARISSADAERLSRYLLQPGDIVYSRRGDVERRALITERESGWLCGTGCLRVRFGRGVVDPQFASYFLSHPASREWVVRHAVGATMPNLNTSILGALPFLVPPLSAQREIAGVLGALDDKIASNRRTSESLERLARAIFRVWFVDFEPVKAKAAGACSFPGMPQDAFDALPTHFVPSELGPIPEGWRVGKITDCCTHIQNGGTPSRNETRFWENGDIPWLTSGEVRQPIITTPGHFITDAGLKESSAKWISPFSTVIALYGATAGQVSLVSSRLTTNQAVCALIPKKNHIFFNYLCMRNATTGLENKAVGSAQQNISKRIVEETQVILPPVSHLEGFEVLARPLFEHWISNLYQSRRLAALRDYLLPKLLSGEVRVAEELT